MIVQLRRPMVAVLAAALAVAAWGYPTLYGDTGLVQIPSADVMPQTYLQLAANYATVENLVGNAPAIALRLSYGISPDTEFSLVVSQAMGEDDAGFDTMGGGIKVTIAQEDLNRRTPGIALGARAYVLRMAADRTVLDGYAVLSKALLTRGDLTGSGSLLRAHGGVSYTSYSGDLDGSFVSPFLGISYASANGNSVVLDYLPAQEDGGVTFRQSTFSASLRRKVGENFWLELGGTRPFGVGANKFYAGVMYHTGDPRLLDPERQIFYY